MKAQRCKARSSRSGAPCKRFALLGASVCTSHGGAAPQVRRTARERLAGLVDPAITRLAALVRHGRPDHVALAAARDVLDRAGLAAPKRFELSVELHGLRDRLFSMGSERSMRLAELLNRPALDAAEEDELAELRGEAGLMEGPDGG